MLNSNFAQARYRINTTVKYMGFIWEMPKAYTLTVDFMTGQELNEATQSYTYSSYSNYAVIWFAKGECAIVKIKEYLLAGSEFEEDDIGYNSKLTGYDKSGVFFWEICVSDYCY